MRYRLLIYFTLFVFNNIIAYDFSSMVSPLKIPLYLSGNFGELRNNHFHSGLDFKTQGRTGFNVYSMDDGYVSRVLVSPWGFGRAIYIEHSNGVTTVYGHLQSFAPFIDNIIKAKQYSDESFSVDIKFKSGEIPVSKGQIIALSGNAGSSGGPHLHLDFRDTKTTETLNPLPFFKQYIRDEVKPEIRLLALYPLKGQVNGNKNCGSKILPNSKQTVFTAWGEVYAGVKAYDKMSGVHNIYGVYNIELFVDDKLIFSQEMNRYFFEDTRAINALIDYEEKVNNNSWIMLSYIKPGNPLRNVYKDVINNGIITINEEREYLCKYVLTDMYGNKTECPFRIKGEHTDIAKSDESKFRLFKYNKENKYLDENIYIVIPQGALYEDLRFKYSSFEDANSYSKMHVIQDITTPLHKHIDVHIKINRDIKSDKNKYYVECVKGKSKSVIKGKYDKGYIIFNTNNFGKFTVKSDETLPQITAIKPLLWGRNGVVSVRISDIGSGVETYRGEIDGKFVLFELDGKSGIATYKLSTDKVSKDENHTLKFVAIDACGNISESSTSFIW